MSASPAAPGADRAVLTSLGVRGPLTDTEAALYVRYLRALALLCECRPYLDEPDYAGLIDELLDDAASHYPFDVERDGDRRGLVPRVPPSD
ncbi:MAG: hypothetical protein HS109_17265 [Burkholderiales bacterium]|nr:hypothetical protein [Burkholderiales bacterium]MCE7875801.1 hypothetical protein [Betaproteobacteria bacterium PRO3]